MQEQVEIGVWMRTWINWCGKTTSKSVVVNGSHVEPFNLEKGLRQVDLISFFLFTIISKSLTFVIKQAQAHDIMGGLKFDNDEVELTHL